MSRLLALLLLLAPAAAPAREDAHGETLGPRTLALGEALGAAAVGSAAINVNPAGVALARIYVLEGTYGYRPEDRAHLAGVNLCDSVTNRVGACFFYDYMTSDPALAAGDGERRMHEGGLTLATALGSGLLVGVTQRYVDYEESETEAVPADHSREAYMVDAGAILRIGPTISLGTSVRNLVGADAASFPRTLAAGAAFQAGDRLHFSADGRWMLEGDKGRYGLGAEYFYSSANAQSGYPLRLGGIYDALDSSGHITGGVGLVTPKLAVDVGVRQQLSGGDAFALVVGLRVFAPNYR